MEAKRVFFSRSQMTEIVLPSHTNYLGSVFGGVIFSWIDIAAVIAASRHSAASVVTASIDALNFIAPVYTGWIVNLKSQVNFAGKTSMEVGVRVDAENPVEKKKFHTASAYLTIVAIDENKKPKCVPGLILETAEDKRRNEEAKKRREKRLAYRKKN